MEPTASPIVFFDGVCNFCNASVNFILDHERSGELRFAPLTPVSAAACLLPVSARRQPPLRPTRARSAPGSIRVRNYLTSSGLLTSSEPTAGRAASARGQRGLTSGAGQRQTG